jgi:hypothetical protein
VDYIYSGVNKERVKLAPPEVMQFGKALQRVLAKVVHANPYYGPVYLSKIDIADGFYRNAIHPRDVPCLLALVLPKTEGALVGGGTSPRAANGLGGNPPYFTSVTETACDLLSVALRRWEPLPPHHLESLAATPPSSEASTPLVGTVAPSLAWMGSAAPCTSPLTDGDVYVWNAE